MSFRNFKKQVLDTSNLEDPDNILRVINTLQNNISDSLQPMIVKIQNDSGILTRVSLVAGSTNVVSHLLGRKLLGWNVIRLRGEATVWDDQDNNLSPNLTLLLLTSADVVVDLEVF